MGEGDGGEGGGDKDGVMNGVGGDVGWEVKGGEGWGGIGTWKMWRMQCWDRG